jgi:hypothetical protein
MENILLNVGNNAQKMLPVPYSNLPVPSVPNSNNYGNSPYPLPVKPTPNRKNDELQYCNFLEPSPRNQSLNVPYEGNKNCPDFKSQPYNKDSCYLMDSKAQGVVGIVCNQAGGSDNANFYRGNQFGVDYPFNQNVEKKKLEYTVEQPVQLPMELKNPSVVYDSSTFYPEENYFLRKNKDYLTYPLQQNYTEFGLPTYNYPYKTLNPLFNETNIESFTNNENNKKSLCVIIMFLLVIFLIYYSM